MSHKVISDKLKSKGNQCFVQGNYEESIKYYSEAIDADPSNAALFSNRAFANIKLKRFFQAEQDCTVALELDVSFDKAFYRRGLARKELKRYKSALQDFKQALKLSPNSSEIQKEYSLISNLLKSTSKLRIEPLSKSDLFNSCSTLKQISIENADVANMTVDISSDLSEDIKKLVASHVPKTYGQFEYNWRLLSQNETVDKVEFLQKIEISDLEAIFAFPFEPQLLFEVIQVLSKCYQKQMFVWQVLQLIAKMPRFSLNILLFGDEEFQVLYSIFQSILKSDIVENEKVISLAKMFNLTIG